MNLPDSAIAHVSEWPADVFEAFVERAAIMAESIPEDQAWERAYRLYCVDQGEMPRLKARPEQGL